MGIVNITPDSFSDGGRFFSPEAALAHARQLIADGPDLLDLGAESTRPRARHVSEAEELERLLPVVEAIRAESDIPLSIDTMKPNVARAALGAGADIWNDVTALRWSPESLRIAAELGKPVVLMHMLGEPRTMQDDPCYEDVVAEVAAFLEERAQAALAAGVPRENILVDPGIGFGKTLEHNLTLLRRLDVIAGLGFPLLLGVSRKRFIGALDVAAEPDGRLGGSLAAALLGSEKGAAILRVHDVRETVQAVRVHQAIVTASGG